MSALTASLSVSAIRTGLWCDTCLLPSVTSYDIYLLTALGIGDPIPCSQCASCNG